jgi:CubicO group peptidase (beta-lactamase class C family)
MSVTKSIVSLVIGQLVDRKLLALDQSVADFVPAWKGTPKEAVTVSHILAHTSGLADKRTTEDIYAAGDFVAFAIEAELEHSPGERFFYSNRASNLLAPIVAKASGVPLDVWARDHLFAPLGITDFVWETDDVGNVQVMAGLKMSAKSLAKVGQLVLCGGRVGDDVVISESWIHTSTEVYAEPQRGTRGLLWWIEPERVEAGFSKDLFEKWRATGVPEDFIAKFRHLEDRYFPIGKPFFEEVQKALIGRDEKVSDRLLAPFYAMTWKAKRPDCDVRRGPVRSVSANGYGGQLLAIIPSQRLVVVRLREVTSHAQARKDPGFLHVINKELLGVEPQIHVMAPHLRLLFGAARPVFRLLRPWFEKARRDRSKR